MSVEIKALMAASAERAIKTAQAAAAARAAENLVKLSDDAKASVAIGKPSPARAEEIRRDRERKAYAATRAPKIEQARAASPTTDAPIFPEQDGWTLADERAHRVRLWDTWRDAGMQDTYLCVACGNLDYQCTCPCECGCACTLKLQCECTCTSAHRRQCTRKTGKKCECSVACTCKCRCPRTTKHMMERELTKPVMVWNASEDPDAPTRRPATIDGQEVMQSHGYSPMRSRKFGTAKKSATRWQRPTENAALGATPVGMWEGDDYVTLNMTTAQLSAFTVAHKFVMGKVPAYKGNAKQSHLETLLTGSKGRDDTHSVRMFTAADLRKMGKKLPVKLKRGILRPIFGDN